MKKINEKPFELLGFSYQDYLDWCEENLRKPNSKENKSYFFKLIYDFKLIKKDGKIVDLSKEN